MCQLIDLTYLWSVWHLSALWSEKLNPVSLGLLFSNEPDMIADGQMDIYFASQSEALYQQKKKIIFSAFLYLFTPPHTLVNMELATFLYASIFVSPPMTISDIEEQRY